MNTIKFTGRNYVKFADSVENATGVKIKQELKQKGTYCFFIGKMSCCVSKGNLLSFPPKNLIKRYA